MLKTRLFCAGFISLMLCHVPGATVAATPSETRVRPVAECLADANRAVTQKSQYHNGSPRLREALKNAYQPGVSAAKKACRAGTNLVAPKAA